MQVTRNQTKDFDFKLDLDKGEEYEAKIIDIFEGENVHFEVKTEDSHWQDTGNICIEFRCYDKPSGIFATKADYWIHALKDKETGEFVTCIIMPYQKLYDLCREYKDCTYTGGENNASRFFLIPIDRLGDFWLGKPRIAED